MSTELILIRHGNAVRVHGDYFHAPLTPLGEQQAEQTGRHLRLEHHPFGGFYTSPVRRARETATIIGLEIDQTSTVEPRVREMELLEAPALVLFEVLSVLDPVEHYLDAHAGKALFWPLLGRVSKALTAIVAMHPDQCVGVVAHNGVILSALTWFFPDQRLHWWTTTIGNCSLTRLRVDGARAELLAANDTHHLTSPTVTFQQPSRTVQVAAKAVQPRRASSGRHSGRRQP